MKRFSSIALLGSLLVVALLTAIAIGFGAPPLLAFAAAGIALLLNGWILMGNRAKVERSRSERAR